MQTSQCGSEIGQRILFLSTSLRLRHALRSPLLCALVDGGSSAYRIYFADQRGGTVGVREVIDASGEETDAIRVE